MKKSLSKRTTLLSRIWQYRASYVLMLPFTLLFVTFVVLPVLVSIGLGFTYYNVFQSPVFVGLENYIRLFFEDDIFMTSIQNKHHRETNKMLGWLLPLKVILRRVPYYSSLK